MDSKDKELSSMIEDALNECLVIESSANNQGPQWLHASSAEATQTISGYLHSVKTGQLPRPSQGAGLGFSRGLGEWAGNYETLMSLAYKIDNFYSKECNCERFST